MRRVGVRRAEMVEVVAGDFAQHLGEARLDLGLFALVERLKLVYEIAVIAARLAQGTEAPALARHGKGIDGQHVVHHVSVLDRTRAAGVVAGHAAERRLGARRHVHGKPLAVLAQRGIQLVEHHPGLDHGVRVADLDDLVQVLRVIDDERRAHRLAALRAASTARQDGYALLGRDRDGSACGVFAARHNDAERLDLIDRGVGRVAAAARDVEHHFAVHLLAQALGERRSAGRGKPDRRQGSVHGSHG
jgi:hypothetical protein